MSENSETTKLRKLLIDVYRRFKNKEISKEDAKCECELLTAIIKTVEIDEMKQEIAGLKILLTK